MDLSGSRKTARGGVLPWFRTLDEAGGSPAVHGAVTSLE
jgi:hypothetical protein